MFQIGNAGHPIDEPWRVLETFPHRRIVEAEPARSLRRGRGIGRDKLEKGPLSDPHEMIMRAHDGVGSPGRNHHPQRALDMGHPLFERQRRDGQMIENQDEQPPGRDR